MAVQKSRKTRSKGGMHRAHQALSKPALAIDSTTGETHRRHHITESGYYRGREVVSVPIAAAMVEDASPEAVE